MHRDKYGIIGQIQQDGSIEGGDSACWNGHWAYLGGDYDFNYVKTFEKGFGGFCRHPHPEQTYNGFGAYYKNPWNGCVSRDQFHGVLLGIIAEKNRLAMLRVILQHACRGFLFAYNTIPNGSDPATAKWKMFDITFMNIWAMELRGFGMFSWLFWPLLCVLDLHLLIDALYDRAINSQDPDVINFIGRILVSREHVPTPISWLVTKIVRKDNLISRLKGYWCGWRDNCEFVALFQKKLDKILG